VSRSYIICEGHGEQSGALQNLVVRLWQELGLAPISWARTIRGVGIAGKKGLSKYCELVRAKPDAAALLIVRDEDDRCPKDVAPSQAAWLRELGLQFPVALVLAHREYESLFLASIESLRGRDLSAVNGLTRPGIQLTAEFSDDPQDVRDAKGWISRHMPPERRYKPTVDQLPLTQLVDFELVRASGLPWFGTLQRALQHLSDNLGAASLYPPPLPADP
jgi:hypothetical protein